jgi:hypothetical protein
MKSDCPCIAVYTAYLHSYRIASPILPPRLLYNISRSLISSLLFISKMQLAIVLVACISTLVGAVAIENPEAAAMRREILLLESRGVNEGRAVASGACCIADVSKKEDVCNVNGAAGKCVPANSAGCKSILP